MTLTFAIGPVHRDTEGQDLRRRVAMRLVDRLHAPVEVVAARSYAEVSQMIVRGDADFAWLPPAVYARAEPGSGIRLLARVDRSGGDGYRGVLFVPQRSSVRGVADLRGLRMAWVDRDSCAGHLFVRLALRAAGHEPVELFGEERFLGSHHAAVQAVLAGEADCGATHAQTRDDGETLLLTGWFPFVGTDGMRSVLVSDPIPSDVICASAALDADVLDALREALLELHEPDEELLEEFFGGPRLVAADAAAYDPVRQAMA